MAESASPSIKTYTSILVDAQGNILSDLNEINNPILHNLIDQKDLKKAEKQLTLHQIIGLQTATDLLLSPDEQIIPIPVENHKDNGIKASALFASAQAILIGKKPIYIIRFFDQTDAHTPLTDFSDTQSKYKLATDSINLGVWDVDLIQVADENSAEPLDRFLQSTAVFFSNTTKTLLGLNNETLTCWQDLKKYMHPHDRPIFDSVVSNHLSFQTAMHIECRLIDKSKDYQWFEIKGESVRDKYDSAKQVTGSIQNCTAQKEMLQAVLESEEAKKMALDAANIGIWTGNLLDSTWTWDEKVDAIFEFTPEQQGNMDIWKDRMHSEDREIGSNALDNALNEAIPFDVSYRINTPSNQIKHIVAKGMVTQNVFGDLVRIDGICYDNTIEMIAKAKMEEIKEDLEERVQQRTKELEASRDLAEAGSNSKSNFLAMMSHEIRTPMNGVIGALDLVDQSSLDSEQRELITTAQNSALNLVSILNDILDLNKIEAGKLQIENIDISVSSIIDNIVSMYAPIAQSNGLEFELIEQLDYIDRVNSDPVRIRQIISNIVSNSVKFTETNENTHGKVTLTVRLNPEKSLGPVQQIEFIIEDNGIGMKPEAVEKLFTPFTQAEDSTTRKYGGTGLGLSICGRLSDMLGGEIKVESEYGQGSKFIIGLPLWPAKEEDEANLSLLCGEEFTIINPFLDSEHWVTELLDQQGAFLENEDYDSFLANGSDLDQSGFIIINALNLDKSKIQALIEHFNANQLNHTFIFIDKSMRTWLYKLTKHINKIISPPLTSYKIKNILTDKAYPEVEETREQAPSKPLCSTSDDASVLIVEDNPLNQKLLTKQITQLGYKADLASNGLEGISLFNKHRYKIILTDCHMPEMDGYSMSRNIRQQEQKTDANSTPIVALTGAAMTGDKEKCLEAGMDDFITKPIQTHQLKAILEKWHA
ncbi:PAS domain-containing hybrid sensor histidine kinase/response regulator [Algibacillus agarilyticus]|uniref:PAS domain-containing hybrid sensor histidine kinase/response regulator n=1 Tax=Algibacillus agarilyticus TaxID=2234133 RepID=UPI000DD0DADA|nr:PAS domain-containing hybrid sensor histidine kinase/response regulator [Algibacillus agarilyticus]